MKPSRIAIAIIVLAGGWLAATAYTKHSVDQAYRAQIEQLEKQLPMLHVSDLKQQGGMFSGSTSGVVHIGCPPVGGKPDPKSWAIAFEDHIQYGPFPGFSSFGAASVDSHLALTDATPADLRAVLAPLAPAKIHTVYGYGGGANATVLLPAGELNYAAGEAKFALRWAELRAQIAATRDNTQLQYDWALPELAFSASGPVNGPTTGAEGAGGMMMKVSIKNLVAQGESTGRAGAWLREGKETSSIERMEFSTTGPQAPPMNFIYDHLAAHTASHLNQDFFDVDFGYTLAGMEVSGAGPGAKVANLTLDGKAQHLHAPSLEKMITSLLSGVDRQCALLGRDKAEPPQDPRAQVAALFQGVDEAAKVLVAHDPAFSIDKLAFDFGGKRGEMSVKAQLKGLDVAAMSQGGPQAAQLMAQAAQVEARARIPVQWLASMAGGDAERSKAMADGFVAQGFAKRDGENLTAEFTFAQGVSKLNGAVFPPRPAQASAPQ